MEVCGTPWFDSGDVDMTIGTLECLDVVSIDSVKHIVREPVASASESLELKFG